MPNIQSSTLYRTSHFPYEVERRLEKIQSKKKRLIAESFAKEPEKSFGPTHLRKQLEDETGKRWLDTSVRRAITNLTDEGFLIKTSETVDSLNGGVEHTWRFKGKDRQMSLL